VAFLYEKHTNISSTNRGHGLCYYFFIVEVKEGRAALGTQIRVRIKNRPTSHPYLNQFSMLDLRDRVKENGIDNAL